MGQRITIAERPAPVAGASAAGQHTAAAGGPAAAQHARYWPGLDGMRAIAIAAVVIYHLSPGVLPGGFFGVDLFFVISGYLISSLLADEFARHRRIDLPRFWLRRIRRLYPAVVAVVLAVVIAGAILTPAALVQLRTTIPAALLYLTNWSFVYHRVPYFQAVTRPSLLIHFWSLAIEEQYYLIWPPVLVLLFRRWRRPGRIALVALVAAAVSSVWMIVLFHSGASVDRIYYGSDTHAQGLLLGSALGLLVPPGRLSGRIDAGARRLLDLVGGGALVAFVAAMLAFGQASALTWDGGLLLVVVLSGAAVVVAAHPGSRLSKALSVGPLRWLGTRSYSVYLWHWPVLDLTRPHQDVAIGGFPLLVFRLSLIVVVSEASYRFIEQPWRTGQAQRWIRSVVMARPWKRWGLVAGTAGTAGVAGLIVALLGTASVPPPPGALRLGRTAAASQRIEPVHHARAASPTTQRRSTTATTQPPTTSTSDSTTTTNSTTTSTSAPPTTAAPTVTTLSSVAVPGVPKPLLTLPPAPGGILAIGDSVMLGASPDLTRALGPGAVVDAAISRQVYTGLDRLAQYRAAGRLKGLRALVINLGTNGVFTAADFQQLVGLAQGIPLVVMVNVRVPDPWQAASDATIDAAAQHPGFVVANWYQASSQPGVLWPDQIHPDPLGQVVYSNLIVQAIATAEQQAANLRLRQAALHQHYAGGASSHP